MNSTSQDAPIQQPGEGVNTNSSCLGTTAPTDATYSIGKVQDTANGRTSSTEDGKGAAEDSIARAADAPSLLRSERLVVRRRPVMPELLLPVHEHSVDEMYPVPNVGSPVGVAVCCPQRARAHAALLHVRTCRKLEALLEGRHLLDRFDRA